MKVPWQCAKYALMHELLPGSGFSCWYVAVVSEVQWKGFAAAVQDKRLAWYDLDLSTKPYRSLRYHEAALRGVAYHSRHPLFASASDDGALHVFHGMVYQVLSCYALSLDLALHQICAPSGGRIQWFESACFLFCGR